MDQRAAYHSSPPIYFVGKSNGLELKDWGSICSRIDPS
jgi:hypothetical protein